MRRVLLLLVACALAVGCASDSNEPAAVERPSTTSTPSTTAAPTTTTSRPAPVTDPNALRPPEAATTPAALARQIADAEAVIRDATRSDLEVAEAALAQQVAYRQLGTHPEWDLTVLDAVPAELHPSIVRHAAARRAFRGMHTKLSDTLPAWRIVAPVPAAELVTIYQDAGAAFGISWPYLAAIHLVETGTGRIRGTSTAGAQGPMQFLPSTWAAYGDGGDINDTRDAIFGAARYLAANNGATDIDNALYRYNNSNRYVAGVKLYAELIDEHPRAFLGLYHWGVWYLTTQGDRYLPVGYEQTTPIPATDYRP
ncbi:MAG: lytic transglycosylase domain-containing protein [Acidimicrobiales bacterium]